MNEQEWTPGMTQFITLNWWMFTELECFFLQGKIVVNSDGSGNRNFSVDLSPIIGFYRFRKVLLMDESSSYPRFPSDVQQTSMDWKRMLNTFIMFIKYLWSKSWDRPSFSEVVCIRWLNSKPLMYNLLVFRSDSLTLSPSLTPSWHDCCRYSWGFN